jgi:hypothetical protein
MRRWMTRHRCAWIGAASTMLGAAAVAGCATTVLSESGAQVGASSSSTGSSSSSGGQGGGPAMLAGPPGPPMPAAPDGVGATTFAMSKLYLGDTDRDGTPDPQNGWRQYGFNIDGLVHASPYKNLCQPADNAPAGFVFEQGDDGIENAFGHNILPILLGISASWAQDVDASISSGDYTVLFSMADLGSASTYDPLLTRLYQGAPLGTAPKLDGTDAWPVQPGSLNDPTDVTSAKVQFPASYLTGDTWVSGGTATVTVTLVDGGFVLPLTIQHAQIAFSLDPTHRHGTVGTVSGVLDVKTFTAALVASFIDGDPVSCDPGGPSFQSVYTEVAQAADMLGDGTQDPTKTCDGISIGLGFDAELVQLGPIAPAAPPPPNPCADGG